MHKIFLTIVIIGLLFAALLAKQDNSMKIDLDNTKLLLMPSRQHDINTVLSTSRESIMFADEISIFKTDVQSGEARAFFLNKDMIVEGATINGEQYPIVKIEHLRAEHFQPRLRLQALIDITQMSHVYCLPIPDLQSMPDTLKIRVNYYLPLDLTAKHSQIDDSSITLRGENFWYPRNVYQDERVRVRISTPSEHRIFINDVQLGYDINNYRKIHTLLFTDSFTKPANVRFLRQ